MAATKVTDRQTNDTQTTDRKNVQCVSPYPPSALRPSGLKKSPEKLSPFQTRVSCRTSLALIGGAGSADSAVSTPEGCDPQSRGSKNGRRRLAFLESATRLRWVGHCSAVPNKLATFMSRCVEGKSDSWTCLKTLGGGAAQLTKLFANSKHERQRAGKSETATALPTAVRTPKAHCRPRSSDLRLWSTGP